MTNLNQTNIKKKHSQEFKTKNVKIGGEYNLKMDVKFKDSKIITMIQDMTEKIEQSDKDGKTITDHIDIYSLIVFYAIKHFTSFGDNMKGDYKKDIEAFYMLVDLGFFNEIAENFDEKELQKISEKMVEAIDRLSELEEEMKVSLKENEDKIRELENGDIILGEVSEERKNEKSKHYDPSLIDPDGRKVDD